jgi:hypothetical protein
MPETLQKPEILTADERLKTIFQKAFTKCGLRAGKHGWDAIKDWDHLSTRSENPLLIILTLQDIDQDKIDRLHDLHDRFKMFLLFRGDMPLRSVVDRLAWLNIRDEKRIHFVDFANYTKKYINEFANRLIIGLDCNNDDNRILDAWWEENVFVVVSPSGEGFKKLRVPLEKLSALAECPKEVRDNFNIDEDGVFIYWPHIDVHLGWEQFEQAVDEQAYLKAKLQSDEFNRAYGAAIRKSREKHNMLQTGIKGLTSRQIRRIESGKCRATYNALCKFAEAQGMSISEYLEELAELMHS